MFNTLYNNENNFEKIKGVDSQLVYGNNAKRLSVFFSIVIPTYNRTDLLKEAIESALNQVNFFDYEILVVDNNPDLNNNKNRLLIEKLNDKKIKYYVNRENIGMVGNWNRGIELSSGQYIVMLHDDDIISPYFLSVMKNILTQKMYSVVGVDYKIFKNRGELIFDTGRLNKLKTIDKVGFFFGETINIAGITFNRDLAIQIGGFNPSDYPNSDTYFIYRSLLYGKVVNYRSVMAGYRIENNETLKNSTLIEIIKKTYLMRNMIGEREIFAKYFLKVFKYEFVMDYILSAEKYWNVKFQESEIATITDNYKFSRNKYRIMRFVIKIFKNRFIRRCMV